MPKIKKILIVCTGNSCRSPMAEGFLKKYLSPEDGFEIVSVGVSAISGFKPALEAMEAMKEVGVDISSYVTKPFSANLAKSADIILVMTEIHKEFILEKVPEVKDKVYLFKEFAGITDSGKEVIDPLGQPTSAYRGVREELERTSKEIARKIKEGDRSHI